jgi:hypothetical protein
MRPVLWRRLGLIIAICAIVVLLVQVIRGFQTEPRHGAQHGAVQGWTAQG